MAKEKLETKEKSKKETVDFKPLKIGHLNLKIIGKTPYLPEPMDMEVVERYNRKKAKQMFVEDDSSEEEKVKKKFYYTADKKIGIPARAFYNAMIKASTYFFEKSEGGMRNVKEGVNILGDILPLKFKRTEVRTDWGRSSGRTRAPRKIMRNAIFDWSCNLEVEYNQSQMSAEQIVNILNWAGFHIGVGGFRKEKTGTFGSFAVEI